MRDLLAGAPLAFGLIALVLSGCVTQPLVVTDLGLPLRLPEPWRENWTPVGSDFAFDLDPSAQVLKADGTLRIRNDLGAPRGYLIIGLEPYRVSSIRDEAGQDLSFQVEEESVPLPITPPVAIPSAVPVRSVPWPPVPEDAAAAAMSIQILNVTLTGDVAPGAVRTLRLAYDGWGARDRTVAGGGAPSDLGMPRLALQPFLGLVSNTGQVEAPSNFTLRYPADWLVLATAELVESSQDGNRRVDRYFSHTAASNAVMAQGLESLEEDVNGIQLRTFFFPDMRVQGQTAHDITRHALTVMPTLTGPYPFKHLWTVPNQVALNAFSTPGMTFMGINFYRAILPGAPLQFSRAQFPAFVPGGQDSYEQVLVHEHTHNWWGANLRGNNTDPDLGPIEVWVTEGVTTYLSELVWMKTQYGEDDAAITARDRGLDVYRARVRSSDGQERAITEPGGLSYSKTAMSLRALEAYAIFKGKPHAVLDALQLAQQRYGRLQGGPGLATTEQMFAVFEEAFGEPLDWHFQPWFFGRDLTDFHIDAVARGSDNATVTVANHGPVPAAVQLKATTLTGRTLWAWGFVQGPTAQVSVPIPPGVTDPIVRVEADPYQYVYEIDDTDNVWQGVA